MKSKITYFIAISFVLSLFSACKDEPKKIVPIAPKRH